MRTINKSENQSIVIGQSVEGRDIVVRHFGGGRSGRTLLIGGQHGDEAATTLLLQSFMGRLAAPATPVAVLAIANPDGWQARSRYNARRVDLNRNCDFGWKPEGAEPPGPVPWSEPESRALRDFILAWQPEKIVSLHWALAEIDPDGPQSAALARAMWDALSPEQRKPYRLRDGTEISSICPGSLGQWCGYGLRYPDGGRPAMITLELPYDPVVEARLDPLPEDHLQALHDRWHKDAEAYLRAVEPGVHRMLEAAITQVAPAAQSADT